MNTFCEIKAVGTWAEVGCHVRVLKKEDVGLDAYAYFRMGREKGARGAADE